MAEDFNIVLELLRHIRAKVDNIEDTQRLHGQRLSSIERHMANDRVDSVQQRDELDGLRARLERIERRLELHDPQH